MNRNKTARIFSGKEAAMKTAASVLIVLGLVMVPMAADAGGPTLRASHRVGAGESKTPDTT